MRASLPVDMFMTWLASAFLASRERLRAGTMSRDIHKVCPAVRKRGSVTRSERSWMQPRERRQQIQYFRAFMRQSVKCLDSSIRWKMETLSSICESIPKFNIIHLILCEIGKIADSFLP